MDGIGVVIGLAALVVLVIIGLVPYLLFAHLRLKSKVRGLEQLVARLQVGLGYRTSADTTARAAAFAVHPPAPQPLPSTLQELAVPSSNSSSTPHAFVFKPEMTDRLTAWLRDNWVLAIAAASLALAGLFMVQYGVENGLLTPFWRVIGALGFAAALISMGELMRRRVGTDTEDGDAVGATEFLPSTLAGAGIVVLYVAVFAARALYDLIGPMTSFAGLGAVSGLALVLGWFYGPVLAAVGILGAALVPFLTGGDSENAWLVHYYLAMVASVALGIDTIKRWAWISALGLIASLAGAWGIWAAQGADLHFLGGALLTVGAAFVIPARGLFPRQSGAAFLDMVVSRSTLRPEFPARLTFGTMVAVTVAALMVALDATSPDTVWLALVALGLLIMATTLWTRDAPALYDHALIPGLAFLTVIAVEGLSFGPLYAQFWASGQLVAVGEATPSATPIPVTVWALAAFVAVGTAVMFWRMQSALRGDAASFAATFWAICATVFAPATLLILEFLWSPGAVLGLYAWALVVIAMAALMVLLATRATAYDARAPLRVGLFAVAALTLITLAFFLVLTKAALTAALAVMVLGAASLDRRYALPPLGFFIQLAVAIITFRLVIWPGFDWALGWDFVTQSYIIPYFELAFAFLVPLALLVAAWWMLRGQRLRTALVLESVCWTILGVFLAVTLLRAVPKPDSDSHWVMGLMATIWVALAVNQLYRMQAGGRLMTIFRASVAGAYGMAALASLAMLWGPANPLRGYERVIGPPVFDSLALAYLPLAAVFAVSAWKIRHFGHTVRIGFVLASSLFAALYTGMEIRRLWRGRNLGVPGVTDPELYSYTLALLIASVALLVFAFGWRSKTLHKVAMAGVALTVAKVFLIDMSGLSGLIRVFSFMGLGLSLGGLAWLNRKMTEQWEPNAGS